MPHICNSRSVANLNLYESKPKSRSHLALFESVEKGPHRTHQSDHCNAFGYLGQSFFDLSTSCHQLVRASPDSVFCRLADSRPALTKADRNESSAIFAVLGAENPSYCSNGGRPVSRERQDYQHYGQSSEDGQVSQDSLQHFSSTVTKDSRRYQPTKQRQQLRRQLDSSLYASFGSFSPLHDDQFCNRKTSTPYQFYKSSLLLAKSPIPSRTMSAEPNSSQNRILIKGGKCVNDDAIFDADLYIEDGVIKDIGQHLIVPGGIKTIDARGHYVIPGGIDCHTHFNLPFMGTQTVDDFYSGTRAALAGGTTLIMDFALPEKGSSLVDGYKKWRSMADGVACCDYALKVIIPEFKKGKTEAEMETLVKQFGINSFKCYMAYKNDLMIQDEDLLNVFEKCRQLGALPAVHAENGDIIDFNIRKLKSLGITGPEGHPQSRPEEVEAEAVSRVITLANQSNCPLYIVHVMSRSAGDIIASARNRGCVVFGETITAGFGTDGSHYFNKCWRHAAAHVLSPPLRPDKQTPEHLINLMASGQLQTTGSDHCVFNSDQKQLGSKDFSKIPNGVNGVEERLVILWEKAVKTGKIDAKQFVALTSTNAAKLFNIYPRKGRLAKGSDADIVIWGPTSHTIKAQNHHSNVDFNIFEGINVSNGPLVVISNGKVVLDENGFHVTQGSGRFIPCPPNSSFAFNAMRQREKQHPINVDRSAAAAKEPIAVKAQAEEHQFAVPLSLEINQNNGIQPSDREMSPNFNRENCSSPGFYRGTTRSGVRNLQDSSFNLSGAQIDDDKLGKTAIRVHNPPGGRSSGIW